MDGPAAVVSRYEVGMQKEEKVATRGPRERWIGRPRSVPAEMVVEAGGCLDRSQRAVFAREKEQREFPGTALRKSRHVAEAPTVRIYRRTIVRRNLLPRPNPPREVAGSHGEIADRRSSVDFKEEAPKHGVRGFISLCHSQPLVIHSLSAKKRKC